MFWRQLVLGCAHVCVCVLSCALSPSLSCVSLGFNESGACLLYSMQALRTYVHVGSDNSRPNPENRSRSDPPKTAEKRLGRLPKGCTFHVGYFLPPQNRPFHSPRAPESLPARAGHVAGSSAAPTVPSTGCFASCSPWSWLSPAQVSPLKRPSGGSDPNGGLLRPGARLRRTTASSTAMSEITGAWARMTSIDKRCTLPSHANMRQHVINDNGSTL